MKWISHRGNLTGPNPETENTLSQIDKCLKLNFDVEIDVWSVDGELFLGHDKPECRIPSNWFFMNRFRLWIHCKNIEALDCLKEGMNVFFHDQDLYTLTSKKYIWGNVDSPVIQNMVCVMPEKYSKFPDYKGCYGVCSDYILKLFLEESVDHVSVA